jgi:hypothetical protein
MLLFTGLALGTAQDAHASSSLTGGAQGYWKFDEDSGTTAADATGNGNTATVPHPSTEWVPGKINSGLYSVGFLTQAPDSSSLDVETGSFMLATWIHPTSTPTSGDYTEIMGKCQWWSTGYSFTYNGEPGLGVGLDLMKVGVAGQWVGYTAPLNTWTYIVAVQGPTSVTYYANGSVVGTYSNSSAYLTSAGHAFRMGYGCINGFGGSVDEVGVWNHALSQNDITTLYNNGNGLQYPFTLTSTTGVTSSANPSVAGQPVTYTATVTGNGGSAPTGTVGFTDDGTTMSGCGSVPLSGSTATCTQTPAVGSHTIVATYSGDSYYPSSASSNLTQTVNQDSTTTTVVSDTQPSFSGQSVTFTAVVTANAPGAGTGTGNVTFKDGSTTLGTSALNGSGTTTFATNALSVSTHSMTAFYAGDTNFITSTSGVLTQTVDAIPVPTVTGVSPNDGPPTGGTLVTITGTNFSGPSWTVIAVNFGATPVTATCPTPQGAEGCFTVNSSTQISAVTPDSPVGTYNITVTTAGGTSAVSNDATFTFAAAPIAPDTGAGLLGLSAETGLGVFLLMSGFVLARRSRRFGQRSSSF